MASIPSTSSISASSKSSGTQAYRAPFAIMTTLFFLWGFMTVFNDILIPRFKEAFTLDYFHAMLVQFAFFGAYFIGSLIYFIISATTGDPIAKIGYKNGVNRSRTRQRNNCLALDSVISSTAGCFRVDRDDLIICELGIIL